MIRFEPFHPTQPIRLAKWQHRAIERWADVDTAHELAATAGGWPRWGMTRRSPR